MAPFQPYLGNMASERVEESFSWIDINGARLAYQEIGRGEPMVLVHANISDIRSWDPIKSKLAERFRVLVYSRRYHWPNEPIPMGASDPWEAHAEDLAALIERINIAPVHVLGNSTGASVALILAKRRPDLVRTLLLEEPPAIPIFLSSTRPTLWEVFSFLISQPWSFLPVIMFAATVISPTMTAFQKGDDEKGVQTFARGVLGNEFYAQVSRARLEQMQVNVKPHTALFLGVGLPQFLETDA